VEATQEVRVSPTDAPDNEVGFAAWVTARGPALQRFAYLVSGNAAKEPRRGLRQAQHRQRLVSGWRKSRLGFAA